MKSGEDVGEPGEDETCGRPGGGMVRREEGGCPVWQEKLV